MKLPWDNEINGNVSHIPVGFENFRIANLVNVESSDIKFKISHFPDGQQTIDLIDEANKTHNKEIVVIKSRLNNFEDLELIVCMSNLLRNVGYGQVRLFVPYFLGSRSDRKFHENGLNYIKQVISPIINALKFDKVTVIDPHSTTIEACVNNFEEITNQHLLEFSLNTINSKEYHLISPDAGSNKKIYDLAKKIGYAGEIIRCDKLRDIPTSKIVETIIYSEDLQGKDCFVVDDICDGGRTFLELGEALKKKNCGKLYLVVTHGIFSKGFDELNKYYDMIFTTNSYKETINEKLTLIDVF